MSYKNNFKAMRELATTLGVACPESDEDVFKTNFIKSLNRAAKRAFSEVAKENASK